MLLLLRIPFPRKIIFSSLFSLFLFFSFLGISEEEETPNFAVKEDCTQDILEKHCGAAKSKTQKEKEEEAKDKEEIEETEGFWDSVQNFTMRQMGDPKSCYEGLKQASHCCHDPSDCISGIDTDTVNIMNIFIGTGSKIAASSLSGKGKDISALCKGMKKFSKAGKNLAKASYYRCKAQIHICKRACKIERKQQCKQYHEEVGSCQQRKNTLPVCSLNPLVSSHIDCKNALKTLKENIKKIAQTVYAIEKEQKPACKELKQKAKEIKNNMKELAKTVKSSDECNKQATAGIEETLEEINKLTASKLRIEEAENTVTSRRQDTGGDTSPFQNPSRGESIELNTENPSTSLGGGGRQERDVSADTSPTNNNNNNSAVTATNNPFYRENTKIDFTLKWAKGKNNPTTTTTGGGQKSLNLEETSYDNENPNKISQNKNIKSKQKIALGGGEFGAYESSLSKNNPFIKNYQKQQKKEAAFNKKNISGFSGGGMHENIFERITKRFQSLCHQQKIDCQ